MTEHIIHIGGVGAGKSERARKALGMTREEYEKHGRWIQKMIDEERRHREMMDVIVTQSYFYWLAEKMEKKK